MINITGIIIRQIIIFFNFGYKIQYLFSKLIEQLILNETEFLQKIHFYKYQKILKIHKTHQNSI